MIKTIAVRWSAISILTVCLVAGGGASAQSDLNVWVQDCAQGPASGQKKCELVYRARGLLEKQDRLVALGVTVTSHDGRLLWTAVRGLKPRSAGIIIDNSPVLFAFNCSEEYCFFDGRSEFLLQRMRTGKTMIVRLTGQSWEQHDIAIPLGGFAPLYQKTLDVVTPGLPGTANPD